MRVNWSTMNCSLLPAFMRGMHCCKVKRTAQTEVRRYLKNLTCPIHGCTSPERCKVSPCHSRFILCQTFQQKHCEHLHLMDIPENTQQDLVQSFQNWKSILRILWKYDNEFQPKSFLVGSQQAVICISRLISEGNFNALDGLVTAKAIQEIKFNVKRYSDEDRRLIAVHSGQIVHQFISQVRLTESPLLKEPWAQAIPEIIPATKVEILVVLEGTLSQKSEKSEENHEDKFFCNYRFEKLYEDNGCYSSWIVSELNHFVPAIT